MKTLLVGLHTEYKRLRSLSYIRLFVVIAAVMIIPVLLCTLVAVSLMIEQTKDRFLETIDEKNQQLAVSVSSEIGNLLSVGRLIMSDSQLSESLSGYVGGQIGREEIRPWMEELLDEYETSFLNTKALLPGVALLTRDSAVFGRELNQNVFGSAEFQAVLAQFYAANQNMKWASDSEMFSPGETHHYQCVYLILAIRDKTSLQINGCAVFQIRISMLTNLLMSSTADYQSVFVQAGGGETITAIDNLEAADTAGEIAALSSTQIQRNSSDTVRYRGESYVVSNHTITRSNWHILSLSRMRDQLAAEYSYLALYCLLVVLSLALAFGLSHVTSKRFTRPIIALHEQMRRVKEGNLDVHLPVQSEDEIGELTQQFNDMVRQIKHLMELNTAEQEAKRVSDLQFLQTQINPHFIYNTLTTLRYVLSTADREQADKLVLAMSRLLRYALSDGQRLVTVNRAIEWVKNYLVIADCSFSEPIQVEYEIQPGAQDCRIIKMLIQPIVENAVLHGLKRCAKRPRLSISARIESGFLEIRVQDNGPGFDTAVLGTLREKTDRASIGIRNVDQRIKLYYGTEYGLEYHSVCAGEETGTTVSIRLPVLTGQEEEVLLNECPDRG